MAENKLGDAEAELKPHLVAFGTLDEIYVSQIKPVVLPIISLRRPAYIPAG